MSWTGKISQNVQNLGSLLKEDVFLEQNSWISSKSVKVASLPKKRDLKSETSRKVQKFGVFEKQIGF